MSMWIISPGKVFSSRTISIFGSRLERRLNPLALPMRATGARDSPLSRAIFPERLTVPAQGFDRHDLLG